MSHHLQTKNHTLRPFAPRFLAVPIKILLVVLLLFSFIPLIGFILCCFLIRPFSQYYANKIATIGAAMQWMIFHWIFLSSSSLEVPEIPKNNYLVISNHLSAFDFALINAVNTKMFPHSKYAFKDTLKFLPIVYQAFLVLNCLILKRNFEKDKERIIDYAKKMKNYNLPLWFVLFCEGTRFTQDKKKVSDEFCKEKGMDPFKYVLAPRYKGFDLLRKEFEESHVQKVLDLTFYCKQGEFSAVDFIFSSEHYEFRCDVRIIDITKIEDSEKFIVEAFRRKDELIEKWKNEDKTLKSGSRRRINSSTSHGFTSKTSSFINRAKSPVQKINSKICNSTNRANSPISRKKI